MHSLPFYHTSMLRGSLASISIAACVYCYDARHDSCFVPTIEVLWSSRYWRYIILPCSYRSTEHLTVATTRSFAMKQNEAAPLRHTMYSATHFPLRITTHREPRELRHLDLTPVGEYGVPGTAIAVRLMNTTTSNKDTLDD